MSLDCDCGFGLACPLSGCTDLVCCQSSSGFFLWGWSKILFPILRGPTAVGVNVVYLLGVGALIIIVARWPWGFIVLGCFSLLLELAEVQDLRLAELGELLIELCNYFRLFPDQMTV
jgi:hypothetical protein